MIDWTHVAQLRVEIGVEEFDEVIALFFEEIDQEIAELTGMETEQELAAKLHFLKGSARNLGFDALAECCRKGEARAANRTSSQAGFAAIADTYAQSKALFLDELGWRFA